MRREIGTGFTIMVQQKEVQVTRVVQGEAHSLDKTLNKLSYTALLISDATLQAAAQRLLLQSN